MYDSLAFSITLLRKDFTDYCTRRLQELGLSTGLLFFILYIGKHPGCTAAQLTAALQMDSGYTARSLTRLVQAGFVQRTPDPADHRAHPLTLTETGAQVFRISHELFTDWDAKICSGLTKEERAQLSALLRRLIRPGQHAGAETDGSACCRPQSKPI